MITRAWTLVFSTLLTLSVIKYSYLEASEPSILPTPPSDLLPVQSTLPNTSTLPTILPDESNPLSIDENSDEEEEDTGSPIYYPSDEDQEESEE